jgi:hypothetical protein
MAQPENVWVEALILVRDLRLSFSPVLYEQKKALLASLSSRARFILLS